MRDGNKKAAIEVLTKQCDLMNAASLLMELDEWTEEDYERQNHKDLMWRVSRGSLLLPIQA